MVDTVPLGPFSIAERIGEGGMGMVYRGMHREADLPVAVKVIRGNATGGARGRFHEEVQAHAGLLHPGIVHLFEYGDVGPRTAAASDGDFRVGDPFVVMELADHGTLRDVSPARNWETVRQTLIQILDALAYSHARGVIHRDLKPENILVFEADGASGPDRCLKLADFGIAHAMRREHEVDSEQLGSAAGTPHYMAPEQLHGQWRRYGPWTDLYALGCIAWELVCGRPPFDAGNLLAIATSHETDPRPPLEPQFPVPEGLEQWVRRAMAVEPGRRFRRAADAAWALLSNGLADTPDSGNGSGRPGDQSETHRVDTTLQGVGPVTLKATLESTELAPSVASQPAPETSDARPAPTASRPPSPHPPIPPDWQTERSGTFPAPLVGAGLGLFGLREPPFVNRREACDRIWAALRAVSADDGFECVLVSGEAGTGKSRLAAWLGARAHEVGAARLIRVTHTEGEGRHEGLRAALDRTLRTLKLSRGKVYRRLQQALPPLEGEREDRKERDIRALTEYLRPTGDTGEADGPAYRFESADQRRALVDRTLRRLSAARPVYLWLDDLQWGSETLAVLEHLADDPDPRRRLLVVATVRSDIVGEQPRLNERLDTLAELAGATPVPLAPLSRRHQHELVTKLLPLEEDLAERLTARTEGHPLFAMQLLGHWIEQDAIVVGEQGFRVRTGRQLAVPEDIHDLWIQRLDRLIDDWSRDPADALWRAIERAAALGREVNAEEWRGVCDQVAVDHAGAIRDTLIERGLARRTEQGWAFAHGMLVDSIEQRSRACDRWADHHRACARLLESRDSGPTGQTAARRADHWETAGEWERAIDALWQTWQHIRQSGNLERERDVLMRRERLFERLEAPNDDPRRLRNALELASARLQNRRAPEEVVEHLEDLRRRAETTGLDELVARAHIHLAFSLRLLGDFDEAHEQVRRAVACARQAESRRTLVEALMESGAVELERRQFDAAERDYEEAASHADDPRLRHHRMTARRCIAGVAIARGDDARAADLLEPLIDANRETGYAFLEMGCVNDLGELARRRGDAERARRLYRRCGQLARELDRPHGLVISRISLGLVELMDRRFDAAEARFREAEALLDDSRRKEQWENYLCAPYLTLAAGRGDWGRFDRLLERLIRERSDFVILDRAQAWVLELAVEYAAEADEEERARAVRRVAVDVWEDLGDEEAAASVDAGLTD